MRLALFDFDGTITNQDSLPAFIKFAVGTLNYYWGLFILAPYLVLFILKLYSNNAAKEKLLCFFFKGWELTRFNQVATEFSLKMINPMIRPKALERINYHKEQHDQIVIVSASCENWLKPWCDRMEIMLLCTQLEENKGELTGHFLTVNCHGKEKVNRIKQALDINGYSEIFVYGDSAGDKQMLELASQPFYKPFL